MGYSSHGLSANIVLKQFSKSLKTIIYVEYTHSHILTLGLIFNIPCWSNGHVKVHSLVSKLQCGPVIIFSTFTSDHGGFLLSTLIFAFSQPESSFLSSFA